MDRCLFCGGELQKTTTSYVFNNGENYEVINGVPCYKCTQCGEEEFDRDVIEKLQNNNYSKKDEIIKVSSFAA